jgi:hypothetical protein
MGANNYENTQRHLLFMPIAGATLNSSQKTEILKRCGGPKCRICSFEANQGCMACFNAPLVKHFEYPLKSNTLYQGCEGDVTKTDKKKEDDCKRDKNIECFQKVNKTNPVNFKPYFNKADKKFYIKILDQDLVKFMDKDPELQKLFVAPYP